MKIVLREEVENLGRRGQVVNVAVGYARNYLFPRKLAYEATSGNLKVLDQQRKAWEAKEVKAIGEAREMAARLEQVRLSVKKKSGQAGTLYGSVTSAELAELLAAKGILVDRRRMSHEPIKSVGSHDIAIKLHREVTAVVKLEVVGEEPAEAPVADEE
jgi:large subunit ribosomal protein L9